MIFLVLHILSVVGFLQGMRYAQVRKMNLPAVVAANYAGAALFSAAALFIWRFGAEGHSHELIRYGVLNGCLYVLHMMILLGSYRVVGVGLTTAVASMGMVIPILVAWVLWSEPISVGQWLAVALIPATMLLIRPDHGRDVRWSFKAEGVLGANFLAAGLIGTVHRAASLRGAGAAPLLYQTCLFTAAAVCSGLCLLRRGVRPKAADMRIGVFVGLLNVLATLFLLLALGVLLTIVVYPTANCVRIMLNLFIGWQVWAERIRPRQMLGVAAALAIVLLANLG
ncbi:MAG: hypothetical protein JXR37_24145 [Kiritimatiellae bacterium]|nr:hypothetical protein [Kiritimatiellia bacterium]